VVFEDICDDILIIVRKRCIQFRVWDLVKGIVIRRKYLFNRESSTEIDQRMGAHRDTILRRKLD
jgi:hypothetical protein